MAGCKFFKRIISLCMVLCVSMLCTVNVSANSTRATMKDTRMDFLFEAADLVEE